MNARTLPRLQLRLAGAPLAPELVAALARVEVQQQSNLPSHCQLELVAPAALPAAELGAQLEVSIAAGEPLFSGTLGAIERHYRGDGTLALNLRAYDPLQRLRERRPLRRLEQPSWQALAAALTAELGVEFVPCGDDFALPPTYQFGQTDLDLLQTAAHAGGRYFHLRGARLEEFDLTTGPEPLELAWRRNLFELSLEHNRQPAVASVAVSGWSYEELEPVAGAEAELPLTGRVLRDRLDAERRAAAEQARRTASAITAAGVAAGDSRLRPGLTIALADVDPQPAPLVLARVIHRIDRASGYLCQFDTVPPAAPPPAPPQMTIGVVCDVADPASRGRVRVCYPGFGRLESGWLSVVGPGGGRAKGLVCTPDTGDQVLVLLPDGGLGEGVVLGGLTRDDHPDPGVDGAKVRRCSWHSRGGHRIGLDDGAGRLELHAASGSYLRLDSGESHLHSSRDLTINAPGRTIVIRAARVDFEHAP